MKDLPFILNWKFQNTTSHGCGAPPQGPTPRPASWPLLKQARLHIAHTGRACSQVGHGPATGGGPLWGGRGDPWPPAARPLYPWHRNRQGQAFTIVSILFLLIVAVLAFSRNLPTFTDRQAMVAARIRSIDGFIGSFHQDADRAAGIAAFRAFLALEEFVSQSGYFLNSTEPVFEEVFYNGTAFGNAYEVMANSSFGGYVARVDGIANSFNLDFDTNVTAIRIHHAEPFAVTVEVDLRVDLRDLRGAANWSYNHTVAAVVPIVDLKDPLYLVNTLGRFVPVIKVSNITLYVNDTDDQNDTRALQAFLNESLYRNTTKAPSYLMRFENNLENSTFGIESLVNLRVLGDQGEPIGNNTKSVVDHIYFGNSTYLVACDIQNLEFSPDWLRLDLDHLADYEISGKLDYNTVC